jgi:hypothetical protein
MVLESFLIPKSFALLVGRPGLDPGTLGLKEGCIWSDWSGGVGIIRESKKICPVGSDSSGGVGLVCGMECGICERTVQLRNEFAHQCCTTSKLSEGQPSCIYPSIGRWSSEGLVSNFSGAIQAVAQKRCRMWPPVSTAPVRLGYSRTYLWS